MNPAEKLLVTALRSGYYKQGTGVLCSVGSTSEILYCCLGVGMEVFNSIFLCLKKEYDEAYPEFCYRDTSCSSRVALLPQVAQWLNWTQIGDLDSQYYENIATYLHDSGYNCYQDTEVLQFFEEEKEEKEVKEVNFSLAELNDASVKFEHIAHIIEQGWVKKELVETNFNSLDPDKRLVFQLVDTNPLNGNHEYVKLTKQAIYNTGYNAINLTTMMPTYLTDDQLVKVKGPLTIKKD